MGFLWELYSKEPVQITIFTIDSLTSEMFTFPDQEIAVFNRAKQLAS